MPGTLPIDSFARRGSRASLRCLAIGLMVLGLTAPPAFAAGAGALAREWRVNDAQSDEPSERLKGLALLGVEEKGPPVDHDSRLGGMQRQNWEQRQLALDRRRRDTPVDVGPVARLLGARALSIRAEGTALVLEYDGVLTRRLAPRAGGPVYSAKGDEFVADGIGRSQAWWRGATLCIETLLAPRGTMTEEIAVAPDTPQRLVVHTRIVNPDWRFDADVRRVFDAAGAGVTAAGR